MVIIKTIYKIQCVKNNKVYIGQTKNYTKRRKEHINDLKNNRHCNEYLQTDYNKFGVQSFVYSVIELVEDNLGNEREDYWMNFYGGINSQNIYNSMNSINKSIYMKRKLSNYYKGRNHIEIYGEEKANKMKLLNSIKHKGKKPTYIPYKGKVKNLNNIMVEVTPTLYKKIHNLRKQGLTYQQISIYTNIKVNGVRNIVLNNIHLNWKCND